MSTITLGFQNSYHFGFTYPSSDNRFSNSASVMSRKDPEIMSLPFLNTNINVLWLILIPILNPNQFSQVYHSLKNSIKLF